MKEHMVNACGLWVAPDSPNRVALPSDFEADMLRRTERNVFIYDLVVAARAKHAPTPSLTSLLERWNALLAKGELKNEREKGSVVYRVRQIEISEEKRVAKLLIGKCDLNAANTVYSKSKTGAARILHKDDDEGGDKAAHLIISLDHQQDAPNTYLCFLEGVPGLSHNVVQPLLNAALRATSAPENNPFTYELASGAKDTEGNAIKKGFVPHVELRGHISDEFESDLEHGIISHLDLISSKPSTPLGGNQFLVEERESLRIRADKNLPASNRLKDIIAAMQSRKASFKEGRISFKDPEGNSKSILYDLETGTPLQQIYVKSFRVTAINPPMDESSLDIQAFLMDAMETRLIKDRKV